MSSRARLFVVLACLFVGALAARPQPAAAATLLADDFGPKPLSSWQPSPLGLAGNWDASTGVAAYNGGGHTQLWTGDGSWTDYRFEVKVRLATGQNYPGGIRGRIDPATGAGYAAWLYPGDGVIKLFRTAAWNIDTAGLTLLAQTSVATLSSGTFHTLALVFEGSQISVVWDGSTVLQETDTTRSAGAVALDVSNQPIDYDDVAVTTTGLSPDTLFADDFGPKPLSRWTVSPLGLASNWDASAGVAAYNGGGHTQLWAGDGAWTDYKMEAKFRLTTDQNYPGGIRGRVNPATGESYAAWIYPAQGVIKLYRATAWHIDTAGLTTLGEATVGTIATGTFHSLALVFEGSRISVVYDGTTVIQTFDGTLEAGAVALDVSNQPIDFDDVAVTTSPASSLPVLFSDGFATGLGNWTSSPLGLASNWSAASGYAAYNGGGHTQLYAGNPGWTDYEFEAKVRLSSSQDYPGGLRGRIDLATGAGYAAWLYPAEGVIKLYRATAWHIDTEGLTLLGEASVGSIATGVFHKLTLVFEGSRIAVVWDGATVIDVLDGTLSSGAVALDVSNQPIDFDDVVVRDRRQPGSGPGGPILVLASSSNPFTRYYGEILLAEGLNQYAVRDLSTVTASTLATYDVVILGETALTSAQATMLADWVSAGGNLIAMRPDPQLAGLLGLTSAASTLANGYLQIDTSAAPGQGLVSDTIQFHGTADLYTPDTGTTTVATLYSNATTSTSSPAVTLRSVGTAGGQAAAFTYDLARSIVTTRQGNPDWAGQERDGTSPMRSNDLFFGNAAADPQADWIDLSKVVIPQADEQQRLLANLILAMNQDKKPLPRFWYLPRDLKAAVLMTGDDHGNGGTAGRFQAYQAASPSGCSVDGWECVRATSYVFPSTPITNTQAAAFAADGFEIGLHVNTSCADWTPASLESFYAGQLAAFAAAFPGLAAPATNRTHCIAWSDWASQPKVELAHGIRLDTNYYYWPGSWIQDRPGYMTGSGLPMRFADLDGTTIDVYQAATQMTDESDQTYADHIDTLLDNALGSPGYYGVITANMHTDSASSSGSDAILTSALAREVPIVSAQQMLTWLDGRNGSSFGIAGWSGGTLTFTVTAAPGANGLRALLPASVPGRTLTALTRNGAAVSFTTETIKGVTYAAFPATTGSYAATYTP